MDRDLSRPDFYYQRWKARGPEQCVESDAEAVQGSWSARGKVYPHNLRHLFASTFYEKEKDILHLADILGHKNVNTTRIYTLATGEVHRAQIESLNLFVPVLNTEQPSRNKKQRNNKLCCFFHCGHD